MNFLTECFNEQVLRHQALDSWAPYPEKVKATSEQGIVL